MPRFVMLLAFLLPMAAVGAVPQGSEPAVDQLLALKRVGSPAMSPDGRRVAYTVREADWEENAYETQIWLVDTQTAAARQLTRGEKSSSAPAWSPDGRWLAFVSERDGRRQLYRIDPTGGEAEPLTTGEEGVEAFAWSPDGRSIAFTMTDPKSKAVEERDKKYGEFEIVDQDHRMTHLHVLELAAKTLRRLTEGSFTVGRFDWSPDGASVAFDHRINPDPANGGTSDISVVAVATGAVKPLVTQDGPDGNPVWSPDGTSIAFETAMASPWFYYANGLIASVSAGGAVDVLTKGFDEDPSLVDWAPSGILFSAAERTAAHLYRLDPATRQVVQVDPPSGAVLSSFSFSHDFGRASYIYADASTYPEIAVASVPAMADGRRLTRLGDQLAGWTLGTSEVVSW